MAKSSVCWLTGALLAVSMVVAGSPAGATGGFDDVEAGSFYEDAVAWLVAEGLTTGTSPSTFSPGGSVTRGQAATFLWRYRGEPASLAHPFSDVEAGSFYADAVAWLAGIGVTTGTSATTFSPDDVLTRGQMATLLWRYLGEPDAIGPVVFDDVVSGSFYADAVAWLSGEGITTGTSPTAFSPDAPVTRAQLATFLWRLDQGEGAYLGSGPDRLFELEVTPFTAPQELAVGSDGRILLSDYRNPPSLAVESWTPDVRSVDGSLLWAAEPAIPGKALLRGDDSVVTFGATEEAPLGANAGGYDAFVQSFDVNGDMLWGVQFGTAEDDWVSSVAETGDGGVLVAGRTGGSLDSASLGGDDVFVRRYDAVGELLWAMQFGTDTDDRVARVLSIDDGGFYLFGDTEAGLGGEPHVGLSDVFVQRYNADRTVQWTRQIGHTESSDFGPEWYETAGHAEVAPGGGLLTMERRASEWVPGYTTDFTLRRWDEHGDVVWSRAFSGSFNSVAGFAVSPEGWAVVAGSFEQAYDDPYRLWAWASRVDENGNERSHVVIETPLHDAFSDVAVGPDGEIVGLLSEYASGACCTYAVVRFPNPSD